MPDSRSVCRDVIENAPRNLAELEALMAERDELRRAIVEHRTAIRNAGPVRVQPGYVGIAEAKHRADERLWKAVEDLPGVDPCEGMPTPGAGDASDSQHGREGRNETSPNTVLRWSVEVNREDLLRNDISKPPEEWEPQDVALADRLGLVYAWEVEVVDA